VSFAHTIFYGIGSYAVAIARIRWGRGWTAIAAGIAVGLLLALAVGLFSLRVEAIFFAVIMGTIYGAITGAAIFILAQNYLQALMRTASLAAADAGLPLLPSLLHPDRWLLWLGLTFIASVYCFPTGVVGRLRGKPKAAK
jgi:ABC-type branched-subunit amino acid transport system permease subunit